VFRHHLFFLAYNNPHQSTRRTTNRASRLEEQDQESAAVQNQRQSFRAGVVFAACVISMGIRWDSAGNPQMGPADLATRRESACNTNVGAMAS
jgi:hypothetical protein